jgi:DNA-binding MarR family transcriptional regulator
MQPSAEECAREMLDVVPMLMRIIRTEMRGARAPGVSVPQFRTLVFLSRHPSASLSDVAAFIGLSLPAASVLVDGLVDRELVFRETNDEDRRRIALGLTEAGLAAYQHARQVAEGCLADVVAKLTGDERATVVQALKVLQVIFSADS